MHTFLGVLAVSLILVSCKPRVVTDASDTLNKGAQASASRAPASGRLQFDAAMQISTRSGTRQGLIRFDVSTTRLIDSGYMATLNSYVNQHDALAGNFTNDFNMELDVNYLEGENQREMHLQTSTNLSKVNTIILRGHLNKNVSIILKKGIDGKFNVSSFKYPGATVVDNKTQISFSSNDIPSSNGESFDAHLADASLNMLTDFVRGSNESIEFKSRREYLKSVISDFKRMSETGRAEVSKLIAETQQRKMNAGVDDLHTFEALQKRTHEILMKEQGAEGAKGHE